MVHLDGVRVSAERRIGAEGVGFNIALAALDSGRRISACTTGLAQAALDVAVGYGKQREQFGKPIIDHEGLGFLLADMTAAVESARATYLAAARRRDARLDYTRAASVAKIVATERHAGDDRRHPGAGAEPATPVTSPSSTTSARRGLMQIFEGTNQIQRVIARQRAKSP